MWKGAEHAGDNSWKAGSESSIKMQRAWGKRESEAEGIDRGAEDVCPHDISNFKERGGNSRGALLEPARCLSLKLRPNRRQRCLTLAV